MSRKTSRIAVLSATLAAVGAMSLATTPASAGNFRPFFVNWVVSGSLTPKKLNQPITLPEGSTFNGQANLELQGLENIHGTLTGTVFVPPFRTAIDIPVLKIPTPVIVGASFTQVGKAEGTVDSTSAANCSGAEGCVAVSAPTQANVGLTVVSILGIEIPTHCETPEPITFPLAAYVSFGELVTTGQHFTGTATIPSITCEGLEGIALGAVLTAAMSGPENPYTLSITPPTIKH